jgi:hypothetical protein
VRQQQTNNKVSHGRSETHPLSWNVSILSCIPSMWKTYGFLTALTKTGLSTPQFFFEPELSNATELNPFDYMILSRSLPNFKVFDPTNKSYTDAFGRAVFEYARKRNSQFPLQVETLLNLWKQFLLQQLHILLDHHVPTRGRCSDGDWDIVDPTVQAVRLYASCIHNSHDVGLGYFLQRVSHLVH